MSWRWVQLCNFPSWLGDALPITTIDLVCLGGISLSLCLECVWEGKPKEEGGYWRGRRVDTFPTTSSTILVPFLPLLPWWLTLQQIANGCYPTRPRPQGPLFPSEHRGIRPREAGTHCLIRWTPIPCACSHHILYREKLSSDSLCLTPFPHHAVTA